MSPKPCVHRQTMWAALGTVAVACMLLVQCTGVRRLRRLRSGVPTTPQPPLPEPTVRVRVRVHAGMGRDDLRQTVTAALKLCDARVLTFVYDDESVVDRTRTHADVAIILADLEDVDEHAKISHCAGNADVHETHTDYTLTIAPHCFVTRDMLRDMLNETAYGSRSIVALASLDPVARPRFVDYVHSAAHDLTLRSALVGGWRRGVAAGAVLERAGTEYAISRHTVRMPAYVRTLDGAWTAAKRTRRAERLRSAWTTICRMATVPTFCIALWLCVARAVTASAFMYVALLAWWAPRPMQHSWVYSAPASLVAACWSTLVVLM